MCNSMVVEESWTQGNRFGHRMKKAQQVWCWRAMYDKGSGYDVVAEESDGA